ncbi:MAG: hypothetical protein J6P16_03840 [Eubacterium sp.]|nr:hypothetical protein [Eubacterium sp.]
MNELDDRIKKLSSDLHAPEGYNERIDNILDSLPEKTKSNNKRTHRAVKIAAAVAFVMAVCALIFTRTQVKAGIFELFGKQILSYLGVNSDDTDESGVHSHKVHTDSEPDLSIRMQELVMDEHHIYLSLIVSASPDVVFTNDVTFAYFGVCKGESYNPDDLIGGATSCKMIGKVTDDENENSAQYIFSLSTEEKLKEDEPMVAFFHDLTQDPNGASPKTLVNGKWKINFLSSVTVSKKKVITADRSVSYPILGKKAHVEKISITPLGITVTTDVSEIPFDELGVSDIRLDMTMQMIDGSEIVLGYRDGSVSSDISESSIATEKKGNKSYAKYIFSFKEKINPDMYRGLIIEVVSIK